jgi:hypothetical protein
MESSNFGEELMINRTGQQMVDNVKKGIFVLSISLMVCAGCSCAAASEKIINPFPKTSVEYQQFEGFPHEVQQLINDAELCVHIAGEIDSNTPPEQLKQFNADADKYCPRAHKNLILMREKYKQNKDIMKALEPYYEPLIKDY